MLAPLQIRIIKADTGSLLSSRPRTESLCKIAGRQHMAITWRLISLMSTLELLLWLQGGSQRQRTVMTPYTTRVCPQRTHIELLVVTVQRGPGYGFS